MRAAGVRAAVSKGEGVRVVEVNGKIAVAETGGTTGRGDVAISEDVGAGPATCRRPPTG